MVRDSLWAPALCSLRFWGAGVCGSVSFGLVKVQGNKIRGARPMFAIWNILMCTAQTGLDKGPYLSDMKES